jgi:adenosine deaminase
VALGLYPSYEEHPLPALRAAGVAVTLGSDDPPYWDASIGGEYAVAAERMGFDEEALREVTKTALRAAFVEEEVRRRLLALV